MSDNNPKLNILLHTLDESQAIDVSVIDVRQQTSVTDYMIVCSGRSSRHVKAIAEELMHQMKIAHFPALSSTGLQNGDWALIDFGDFVVHVMQADSRAFYNLEGLWQNVS